MHPDYAASERTDPPRVSGIKTGLALVLTPQDAKGFAEIRAYTFDAQGMPVLHVIDLTYHEADNLRRALEQATGDSHGR